MHTIQGKVHDADGGGKHVLSDCVITAMGDKGELETVVSDEHGRLAFTFEAHDPIAGFRYSLKFERQGYHPTTIDGVSAGDHAFALMAVASEGVSPTRHHAPNCPKLYGEACNCPAENLVTAPRR